MSGVLNSTANPKGYDFEWRHENSTEVDLALASVMHPPGVDCNDACGDKGYCDACDW